jgi:hypothetical protein
MVSGSARNKCEHYAIIGPIVDYRPTQIQAEAVYNLISRHNFIKPVSQFLLLRTAAASYKTLLAFSGGCMIQAYAHCELQFWPNFQQLVTPPQVLERRNN